MSVKDFFYYNLWMDSNYYCTAVICGVTCFVISLFFMRSTRKALSLGLIIVYLAVILASTVLIRNPTEKHSYELFLFWSYIEIFRGDSMLILQNILNILMLMPVGVLLAIGFDIRKKHVVITGVMISLTIEILQLVTRRGLFEFDDILHNSIGCLIGYVVCKVVKKGILLGSR